MGATKTEELREPLKVGYGYLKVPLGFRERFGSPDAYPEPERAEVAVGEDEVKLVYIYDRKALEKVNREAKT